MNKLCKVAVFSMMLLATTLEAQQDTHYTLYRYTMNFVNPAYAGVDNETALGINFRSQWSGIQGAPETQSAFFGTPLGRNVGFGVSVIHDRTFIEKQTVVMADFSYRLQLGSQTDLYLGIKAGGGSYNANTEGLTYFDASPDPSLGNFTGGFKFNVGVGALLKGERYFVAFSVPKFVTSERLRSNDGQIKLDEGKIHAYLASGYDIDLGQNLLLRPSALLRYIDSAPFSLDLTGTLAVDQKVEIGATYRVNEGIGGLFYWNAANWVDLGYAYISEFENAIGRKGRGSHEVFMKFKF